MDGFAKSFSIRVGARPSPLSQIQVEEIAKIVPFELETVFVETVGDRDLSTSLRTLGKTDFFTRELDQMLLAKKIDAAIHSAKDLPDPLPKGLSLALLTPSIDPRDALVYRAENPLSNAPRIATSSERREEAVRLLFPSARFTDLRGTIHQRLSKLESLQLDGVVVAEAALIRLKLTHLPRLYLPGPSTPGQGSLAIVVRSEDLQTQEFFQCASFI